jgi:hypothetical protein
MDAESLAQPIRKLPVPIQSQLTLCSLLGKHFNQARHEAKLNLILFPSKQTRFDHDLHGVGIGRKLQANPIPPESET